MEKTVNLTSLRRWLTRGLAALSLISLTACPAKKTEVNVIRIGVLPNEGARGVAPLQQDLERRLGMKVEFVVPKDYSALVESFKKKDVDFAFFTALIFLQAEREAGAKALLKKVYGKSEFY